MILLDPRDCTQETTIEELQRTFDYMSPAVTHETKELAQQLLTHEEHGGQKAVVCVCEKLRIHLSSLVGVVGFRALLHRALVLSRAESGNLNVLTINEEGILSCFDDSAVQLSQEDMTEVGIVLIARLLVLLEIFIGNALTWNLLQDIWPKLDPKSMVEKTKKL